MKKTRWSDERLRRLFDHYNRLYFRRKIKNCQVVIGPLNDSLGICDYSKRTITIDVDANQSDGFTTKNGNHAQDCCVFSFHCGL